MKHPLIPHLIPLILLLILASCAHSSRTAPDRMSDTLPAMSPDYSGRPIIPRNIAPLRFRIIHEAKAYRAGIGPTGQEPQLLVESTDGRIMIPEKGWAALLDKAAGSSIDISLATREEDGLWTGYPTMTIDVDTARLDDWLVYRLIYPGYELWSDMGIYQRCPYSYLTEPLLENAEADGQCLNCHSFAASMPETMMLHVRGPKGGTIILRPGKEPQKITPTATGTQHGSAYPSWHPSGRFIAFAADEIRQYFHTSGPKTTEVVNLAGDMIVYDADRGTGITDSLMSGPEWVESFPCWAPDGKALYYTRSAPIYGPSGIDSARYDLVVRPFSPATGEFTGAPATIYAPSAEGKSITVPRIHPDGRWMALTRADYGNFMIWHPEAELILLDLNSPEASPRAIDEINAPGAVDSYHSWSSDGRWMVFSSKRDDGLFARPYIARFDASTGRFSPPFILPQDDPDHYDDLLRSYNIPEFVKGRVEHADKLRQSATRPAGKN
ncbi:MAG: hypothetical protein NC342_01935 [Pseudoflavonifractor sp.]|nr:cytochrome C biosynthesis protein [Alloprevotella sp.]MCM1116284.1 hypothetical protein [Pseudoflavonifractor sp.]